MCKIYPFTFHKVRRHTTDAKTQRTTAYPGLKIVVIDGIVIENGSISTKDSTYTEAKDKTCKPGQGGTTSLSLALQLCDQFPCKGIYDKNCDGQSVVVCKEIKPLAEDAPSAGCTYVKDGNNCCFYLKFLLSCYDYFYQNIG